MVYSLDCRRQVVATDVPHVNSLSLAQSVSSKRLAMIVESRAIQSKREMTFGPKKRAAIAFMYAHQFMVGIVCGFFISTLTRTIDLTEHFFDFQSETEGM